MKVVVDANFTGIQCNGTDVHTYVCRLCSPQWWTVNLKMTPASTGTYHWWPLSKPFQSTQGRGLTQEYTAILCVETTIEFLRKRLVPVLWSGPLVTTLHCVHYTYITYNLLWLHLTSHPKTLFTILYVVTTLSFGQVQSIIELLQWVPPGRKSKWIGVGVENF